MSKNTFKNKETSRENHLSSCYREKESKLDFRVNLFNYLDKKKIKSQLKSGAVLNKLTVDVKHSSKSQIYFFVKFIGKNFEQNTWELNGYNPAGSVKLY